MNINNGKTGNVNIPGALHSTGGDGDGQVGGVVAYAGDVYDETLGKNQKEINQTLLDGSADSNVIAVALNDLNEKVEEQEKVTSEALNDLNEKTDNLNKDIEDLEKTTSSSLNDLNDKVDNLNDKVNDSELVTASALADLDEKTDTNERVVSAALNDLNNNVNSKLALDSNNNLIINPKSEVESTATNSLIGGIATVGKGAYAFGFSGNALSVYISGNASDGYQLQANTTSAFVPTNIIRPLFENIYKDTYLLDANTYEKVAKIIAVTPNVDDQKISITLDTDLGTLTNALYRLENISKDKSFNFGVFGNTGDWSSILGYGSYNTGKYSNVIGSNNSNSKIYSTLIGTQNVNTGNYSTLIGYNNKATAGNYPCAIGIENTLNAYGYAIGWKNVIGSNNKNGYLFGFDNYTNTTSSAFLFGQKLVCENSRGGFYIGQYNKEYISNDASVANWFAVGSGKDSSRENAIEVKQNGNIYIYDVGGFTGGNSDSSSVKPLQTVISDIQTSLSSSSSSPEYIAYSTGQGYSIGDTTTASGENSFAEGSRTKASGAGSHAEGSQTKASGNYSHAEGSHTISGHYAHAEGYWTIASGGNSHTEGSGYQGYIKTKRAYTAYSDTIYVSKNIKKGAALALSDFSEYAIVQDCVYDTTNNDYQVTLSNYFSIDLTAEKSIFCIYTIASGTCSHAEGADTIASGDYSHAEGEGTETTNTAEHASGKYNQSTSSVTQFSVGIGADAEHRANAFEVDVNGNIYIRGIGTYDGTNIGQNGVKSVQEVIADLTQQIAALTNN